VRYLNQAKDMICVIALGVVGAILKIGSNSIYRIVIKYKSHNLILISRKILIEQTIKVKHSLLIKVEIQAQRGQPQDFQIISITLLTFELLHQI